MNDRPTTVPCPVRLRLRDGRVVDGTVPLLADPTKLSGFMPLLSQLERSRPFLAVTVSGRSLFVHRRSILVAEIDARGPGVDVEEGPATGLDIVTVTLVTGESLTGVLPSQTAEGFTRLSDVLNQHDPYIVLEQGAKSLIISKDAITSVQA